MWNRNYRSEKHKSIPKDREIELITDTNKIIEEISNSGKNYKIQELVQVEDSIFNITEESIDDVFNKINNFGSNYKYITKCAEYAFKIRLKQTKSIASLILKLSNSSGYVISEELNDVSKDILTKLGVKKLDEYIDMTLKYFELKNYIKPRDYSELSENVKTIIFEDNVESFIKLATESNFDPKKRFNVPPETQLTLMQSIVKKKAKISYMQIMAAFGSVKCFKYALLDGSFDDENLEIYAVAGGNVEIIHLLEQKNADFKNCFRASLIFRRDEVSNWLLSNYECECVSLSEIAGSYNTRGFFFIYKNGISGSEKLKKSLFSFAKTSNIELMKYLIKELNVDPNKKDERDRGALYFACIQRNIDAVKYLVEELIVEITDNDINNSYRDVRKYLEDRCKIFEFVKDGNLSEVKKRVEDEHFPIEQKFNGKTLFHCASENGKISIIKYLYSKSPLQVNVADDEGKTPLHYACENGNLRTAKYLIETCKVDPEETDNRNWTPLHYASGNDYLPIVKYLFEECHVNASPKDEDKWNPLHLATYNNNIEIVKYLVKECHVDVEKKNKERQTALDIAYEERYISLIKFFVEECHAKIWHDVFIFFKMVDGYLTKRRLLHDECRNGNIEEVKFLIKKKKYYPDQMFDGYTPLHVACLEGNLEIVKYLVEECHVNIEEKAENYIGGRTALHIACESGNFDLVKYLVEECHANTEALDNNENNMLYYACKSFNFRIFKYLVEECHVDVTKISNEALNCAFNNGSLEFIEYMVEKCHLKPHI